MHKPVKLYIIYKRQVPFRTEFEGVVSWEIHSYGFYGFLELTYEDGSHEFINMDEIHAFKSEQHA